MIVLAPTLDAATRQHRARVGAIYSAAAPCADGSGSAGQAYHRNWHRTARTRIPVAQLAERIIAPTIDTATGKHRARVLISGADRDDTAREPNHIHGSSAISGSAVA